MMKKIRKTISLILVCCFIAGCGKDIDMSNIIREINWDMTIHDFSLENAETDEWDDHTTVVYYKYEKFNNFPGTYIYRFDPEGKIEFIKFRFDKTDDFDDYMRFFVAQYGKGEKVKYGIKWYGKINGEDAYFYSSPDANIIEIEKN